MGEMPLDLVTEMSGEAGFDRVGGHSAKSTYSQSHFIDFYIECFAVNQVDRELSN